MPFLTPDEKSGVEQLIEGLAQKPTNITNPEDRARVINVVNKLKDSNTPLSSMREVLLAKGYLNSTDADTLTDFSYTSISILLDKIAALSRTTRPVINLYNTVTPANTAVLNTFISDAESFPLRNGNAEAGRDTKLKSLREQAAKLVDLNTMGALQANKLLADIRQEATSLRNYIDANKPTTGIAPTLPTVPPTTDIPEKYVNVFDVTQYNTINTYLSGLPVGPAEFKLLVRMAKTINESLYQGVKLKDRMHANTRRTTIDTSIGDAEKLIAKSAGLRDREGKELVKTDDLKKAVADIRAKLGKSLGNLNLLEIEELEDNVIKAQGTAGIVSKIKRAERFLNDKINSPRNTFEKKFKNFERDFKNPGNTLKSEEDILFDQYKRYLVAPQRFDRKPAKLDGLTDDLQKSIKGKKFKDIVSDTYSKLRVQATIAGFEMQIVLGTDHAGMLKEIKKFINAPEGENLGDDLKNIAKYLIENLDSDKLEEKLKEAWKELQEAEKSFIEAGTSGKLNAEAIEAERKKLDDAYQKLYKAEEDVFGAGNAAELRRDLKSRHPGKNMSAQFDSNGELKSSSSVKGYIDSISSTIANLQTGLNVTEQALRTMTDPEKKEQFRLQMVEVQTRIKQLEELKKKKELEVDAYRSKMVKIPGAFESFKGYGPFKAIKGWRGYRGKVRDAVNENTASQFQMRGWRYLISSNFVMLRRHNAKLAQGIFKRDKNINRLVTEYRHNRLFNDRARFALPRVRAHFWERHISDKITKYQGKIDFRQGKINEHASERNHAARLEKWRNIHADPRKSPWYVLWRKWYLKVDANDPIWQSTNVEAALKLSAKLYRAKNSSWWTTSPAKIDKMEEELRELLGRTKEANEKALKEVIMGKFGGKREEIENKRKEIKEKENTDIQNFIQELQASGLQEAYYKPENAIKDPDREEWMRIIRNPNLTSQLAKDTLKNFIEFLGATGEDNKKGYKFSSKDYSVLYKLKEANPNHFATKEDFIYDFNTHKGTTFTIPGTGTNVAITNVRTYLTYREHIKTI